MGSDAIIVVIGLLAAIITIYEFLIKRREKIRAASASEANFKPQKNLQNQSLVSDTPGFKILPDELLQYYWNYQYRDISENEAEKSWAVKESAVLTGELVRARQRPGLSVAVLSVDLAIRIFGKRRADSRIDRAITWAMNQTSKNPPYFILANRYHEIDDDTEKVYDLRHTIAFAQILALTGELRNHINGYLDLVFETKNKNGSWQKGLGETVSELFSTMYAVMFLGICLNKGYVCDKDREKAVSYLDEGVTWILEQKSKSTGLWEIRKFKDKPWGSIVISSLIINGIHLIRGNLSDNWSTAQGETVDSIVRRVSWGSVWKGVPSPQRIRIESRIAVALSRIKRCRIALSKETEELVDLYLKNWKNRATEEVKKFKHEEMDLSTCIYLLESLYSDNELTRVADKLDFDANNEVK